MSKSPLFLLKELAMGFESIEVKVKLSEKPLFELLKVSMLVLTYLTEGC